MEIGEVSAASSDGASSPAAGVSSTEANETSVGVLPSLTAGKINRSGLLAGILAVTKPKLLPLAALPIAKPMWKSIRYKLRHEDSPAKYVYLPAARMTASTSNLAGFLVGRYIGE